MSERTLNSCSLHLAIVLFVCSILSGTAGRANADDGAENLSLKGSLVELINQFNEAYAANDFQKQRNVMQRVYDIVKRDDSEQSLITAAEARMHLHDFELAFAMSDESFRDARQAQIEQQLGKAAAHRRNYDEAIAHLNKSLELSKVYGDVSFNMLETKMLIAGVTENSGKDLDRGIACAKDVKIELERRIMTDSQLYRKTLAFLFILQLAAGNHADGIETGETLIHLHQKHGMESTILFATVTGIVSEYLNVLKEHEKAYRYASLGLKTCPPLAGVDIKHGLRLLRECARAAVCLKDYEQVPLMYEKILSITATTPGYPDHLRLAFMEEYSAVLETMGDQKRKGEIKQEIEKIKTPALPQKSRYSD